MQRQSQFDDTEVGAEMAAVLGEHGDQLMADVFGQLSQLFQRQFFYVRWIVHHFQITTHRFSIQSSMFRIWYPVISVTLQIIPAITVLTSVLRWRLFLVAGSSIRPRPVWTGKPAPAASPLRSAPATFPTANRQLPWLRWSLRVFPKPLRTPVIRWRLQLAWRSLFRSACGKAKAIARRRPAWSQHLTAREKVGGDLTPDAR